MNIPFLDLHALHAPLRAELSRAIEEVIDRGAFAGGEFVERFEDDFAAYCGVPYAVGVGSGTEALWLTLLALGVGPGDEVITVPNSFMATAEAITYSGARPVFVDVDERTYTMDPAALQGAITKHTKVIMPVHLFGQPADMEPILTLARQRGLVVVADACQAHGAGYHGRKAGALGDVACFSFYPGKNLGALGEAGAIVTECFPLQEKIRVLRDHGQERKYHHTLIGWNGRMDGIQAAVLRVKLRGLEAGNALRRARAADYDRAFRDVEGIVTPTEASYARHVYHVYAVRVSGQRDEVARHLGEAGIGCAVHYPVPVHLQEAYRDLGHRRGAFPVAERCAEEFLSLPMFPTLSHPQVQTVADTVRAAVGAELALA